MKISSLYDKSLSNGKISFEEALFLINTPQQNLAELFNYSNKLRENNFSNKVSLCGITNAKSGKCSEDCSFCSQSAHHTSEIAAYPLLTKAVLLAKAKEAKTLGINCFSLVTSGRGIVSDKEFFTLLEAISESNGLIKSASLGILSKKQFEQLKNAGLKKYHHNLETARSFFLNICTTHTYDERIATIHNAKEAKLEICSGGIFGIGESTKQRVELLLTLKELNVDSVPINILNQIKGTKIYGTVAPPSITEILCLIATARFILPDKTIGVIGGRELHLKDRQPEIFQAGANCIMLGNYLTTSGTPVEDDLEMLQKSNLSVSTNS